MRARGAKLYKGQSMFSMLHPNHDFYRGEELLMFVRPIIINNTYSKKYGNYYIGKKSMSLISILERE